MLEINNISKTFNRTGNPEDLKVALDNISIKINDGDFITIIGGNGSGKTTLMNIITGVVLPDSGNIILKNEDITPLHEYQKAKYFGRVFQDPVMGTCGDMSIWENLELAYKRGFKRGLKWGFNNERKEKFIKQLEEFDLGLENRMNQKVKTLSGGQRQALTLIMATINRPEVLLLDEHTAALDPKTAKKVLTLTDKIVNQNKLTTLMITHNMRDALTYGNRLIMLHQGHILLDVSGKEKEKLTTNDLLNMFDEADIKAEK